VRDGDERRDAPSGGTRRAEGRAERGDGDGWRDGDERRDGGEWRDGGERRDGDGSARCFGTGTRGGARCFGAGTRGACPLGRSDAQGELVAVFQLAVWEAAPLGELPSHLIFW
jgi:hypothetical protein